jgi:hypothetical protein
MKPTKSQKKFLDYVVNTIKSSIRRYQDQIELLKAIELRLTKDGKPRKEFADNFGIRGLPTKVEAKYATQKHYALVSVTNESWLADDSFRVNVKYRNIDFIEAELSGVPEQSGNWIAFNVDHEPTTPEETLELIRTEGVKALREKIAKAKKDLRTASSDKFVQNIVTLGNSVRQLRNICNDCDKTPELYSFKYMFTAPDVLDQITK